MKTFPVPEYFSSMYAAHSLTSLYSASASAAVQSSRGLLAVAKVYIHSWYHLMPGWPRAFANAGVADCVFKEEESAVHSFM